MKFFWNLLIIGTLLFYIPNAYAFTPPTAAPPGGNVAAPINVSGTSQTKTGNLTVSELYAANFRAAPGVPTIRLMGNTGSARAEVWDRLSVSASHGFGGFPDPQSGGIAAAGDIIATAHPGTFTGGGSYISISARGGNLPGYPGNTYPVLKTDHPYIYFAAGGAYAAYLGNGNNYTNSTFGVGNVYAYANVYGPIFYDTNNLGYYLNPDAYSQTYALYRYYGYNGPEYDINNSGYYLDPNTTSRTNYTIMDNFYSYGWGYAPIIYDSNNGGYYIDPNGYSQVQSLGILGTLYGSNHIVNLATYDSLAAWDVYSRAAGKWMSQMGGEWSKGTVRYKGSCSVGASDDRYQDCSPASIATSANFMYIRNFNVNFEGNSFCEIFNQGTYGVWGRARHGGAGGVGCTFDILLIPQY